VTPAEACQERRIASIRRSHRIDALDAGQLANFIHRLAAIVPGDIDRVLAEFDANAPRPRAEPQLHPVLYYGAEDGDGIRAYCDLCRLWHADLEDGRSLAQLEHVARRHSGIEK
jgi:hypothetical protein